MRFLNLICIFGSGLCSNSKPTDPKASMMDGWVVRSMRRMAGTCLVCAGSSATVVRGLKLNTLSCNSQIPVCAPLECEPTAQKIDWGPLTLRRSMSLEN
ncbi:hypothetical protein BD410DRAFT_449059 [Rickenella mellea]|uniref:Secreted protein n=1 Tax=Rickenella mellea TaxID=50990 RepID=A0A4Y7PV89_9AGAM|nr:hypothetical protein BD410DRAFT_449059 [Rickenella mellea]